MSDESMNDDIPPWPQSLMDRHRSILNRLEPHLGCVTCREPLVDGVCPDCDPGGDTSGGDDR